jgi:hypothetical protein
VLLKSFRWSHAIASDDAIHRVEATLGELPAEYVAVLRAHDGGEGWVGDGAYLSLWSIEDVVSRNETLEAANLTPGIIFIGSDGADNLYGIELNSGRYWIFPAIGLSAEMGEEIGQSWNEFLAALSTS